MADFLPLPDKEYQVIYADPPWEYRQHGTTAKSRGNAAKHYQTMTTEDICKLPVRKICGGGAACFMWATFPNIAEAIKVLEAWGFTYKTAAFVWIKKNRKNGGNFWGMGAYTRANAEVCLLGVSPGFKAREQVHSHRIHQVIEAPFEGHSKKPDETRRRIVELLIPPLTCSVYVLAPWRFMVCHSGAYEIMQFPSFHLLYLYYCL